MITVLRMVPAAQRLEPLRDERRGALPERTELRKAET